MWPSSGKGKPEQENGIVYKMISPISVASSKPIATLRTKELEDVLMSFDVKETAEELNHTMEVLSRSNEMAEDWISETGLSQNIPQEAAELVGDKICIFGSYRLGVHRKIYLMPTNDSTPKHADNDSNTGTIGISANRMLKHAKIDTGIGGSPISSSRTTSVKRTTHSVGSLKTLIGKENSSRRSYSMEYSIESDEECSPSKFTITRSVSRERYPLEDQDPNSQDSGFSNSSYLFSEDSKSSSNFRFAEPNGVAPRRTTTIEFSPSYDSSPSSRKSNSPRYRKQLLLHRVSTDSTTSDYSDDGFGDNAMLPTVESSMVEQENVKLPAGFSSLLSGPIFNLSRISESPNTSPEMPSLQTSFRRSLTENLTPNRTIIRSSESEFNELLLLGKDAVKRTANEEESGPFLKRRKSIAKLTINEKSSWPSGPASAPATSTRGTLFNYGFKKISVKYQRSFSETEANIKNALQRATSDPNLIGDFSKPFVLPLKMGRVTDLKNIDCHTLARLINGDYSDMVSSYSIIDCRYPYEFEGGHIKGAVNIYTKEQMMDELNDRKLLVGSNASSMTLTCNKRNILIFHCEFSSERGPSLSRYLRNADREKNSLEYPKLDYPEIYLLEGGYQKFFDNYKELCEPRDYIKMIDPNHSEALRKLKVPWKSWSCTRENRKSRSSYKRLGL